MSVPVGSSSTTPDGGAWRTCACGSECGASASHSEGDDDGRMDDFCDDCSSFRHDIVAHSVDMPSPRVVVGHPNEARKVSVEREKRWAETLYDAKWPDGSVVDSIGPGSLPYLLPNLLALADAEQSEQVATFAAVALELEAERDRARSLAAHLEAAEEAEVSDMDERPEGPEVAERLAVARRLNPDATEYEVGWHTGWSKAKERMDLLKQEADETDADNESMAHANRALARERSAAWAECDALRARLAAIQALCDEKAHHVLIADLRALLSGEVGSDG